MQSSSKDIRGWWVSQKRPDIALAFSQWHHNFNESCPVIGRTVVTELSVSVTLLFRCFFLLLRSWYSKRIKSIFWLLMPFLHNTIVVSFSTRRDYDCLMPSQWWENPHKSSCFFKSIQYVKGWLFQTMTHNCVSIANVSYIPVQYPVEPLGGDG